jgi:hypothetical protein
MSALCVGPSQSLFAADPTLRVPRCNPSAGHSEIAGLLGSADLHHQQRESGVSEPETATTSV